MSPRSLRGRLVLTYLAVLLLGLGGFIAWTGRQLQAAAAQQAEHDLQIQAQVAAGVLRNAFEDLGEQRRGGSGRLGPLLDNYAQTLDVQIVVLDGRLQVLAASAGTTPATDIGRAPEIVAAQRGGSEHSRRNDPSGEERVYAAAPLSEDDHRPIGVIQLSRPAAALNAEIRGIWLRLLTAGGLVALGTVAVSVFIAQRIAQPLRALTATSRLLAAGDLSQRAEPAGPDEIRQLGETFNQMVERLQQMLDSQRAFVAYAAHELRSPLASMRLRNEMLGTDRAQHDPELTQRYREQIERDLDHLALLLDQLLTLSALDEGNAPALIRLDLAPLLGELAEEARIMTHAASLQLQTSIPEHVPDIAGNSTQLRMAIRNLLDNACKYTPKGGMVRLDVHEGPHAVLVSVGDTGPGLSAEQRARIFERFYRGETETAARRSGFGLGLALVQAIVAAHGGQIEVRSAPGEGSIFVIRLPRLASAISGGADLPRVQSARAEVQRAGASPVQGQ